MPGPIDFRRIGPATAAMFDMLVDGTPKDRVSLQWEGALALLSYDYDTAVARGKVLRSKALKAGHNISEIEIAMSGAKDIARNHLMIAQRSGRVTRNGDQIRLTSEAVRDWASASAHGRRPEIPMLDIPSDSTKIRTFAGISETEAFTTVPVVAHERVTFQSNFALPPESFRADLSASWSWTVDESTGLNRIDCPRNHARLVEGELRDWCDAHGIVPSEIRVNTTVRSRNLRSLDPRFLDEMARFYTPFLAARLQQQMSSISRFIPDPEDQRQQMCEWLLAAIREYDETRGAPFGAFLVTRTRRRVYDLPRGQIGRSLADFQNNKAKVHADFVQEHGRQPTRSEAAAAMKMSEAAYHQQMAALDTAGRVTDPSAFSTDPDHEVQVADASGDASANILAHADAALVSAAIVGSTIGDSDGAPNLVAFGYMYMHFYGGKTKTEAAKAMGVSTTAVNSAIEDCREEFTTLLTSEA